MMVVRCWAAFSALLLFSGASEAAVATCDGESDPFGDPSASSGCGCSGTSGGLKRDTALGSTTSSSIGSSSSSIDSRGDGESSTPSRRLAEEADTSTSSSVASLRERNLDSMVYIEGGTFYMGTDHPLIKVLSSCAALFFFTPHFSSPTCRLTARGHGGSSRCPTL